MNVNAAIIDQRLNQVTEELKSRISDELHVNDATKQKSLAFVYLCVKTLLDIEAEEAFDTLTDGGNDFGVDALHIGPDQDGEFVATLFQGKYSHKNLDGSSSFPEDGVIKATQAVRFLFDPSSQIEVNKRLLPKIEEIRSRIRDGFIPRVRFLLCNNGGKWSQEAQDHIDRLGIGDQATWEHVNHDTLISILQSTKPVAATLHFRGKAFEESFDFSRVLIGKVTVSEIAALIDSHGDKLLERNIRRYLGLSGNRVNEGIKQTLDTPQERPNFYFYNNGITMTCSKFSYNALQSADYQVRAENLQIINGGQTSHTIHKVLSGLGSANQENLERAFVLVRLYELASDSDSFVQSITFATNSQNPVDLKDLRANDAVQKRLEQDVNQLGYMYRRKRSDANSSRPEEITSGTAAEAILAVWRKQPHQAKFFAREHFGKLYDKIFTDTLTGAQLVTATLLYRIAENKRKRPDAGAPSFIQYASCFLAMRMGEYLVAAMGIEAQQMDHRVFARAKSLIEQNGLRYFEWAQRDLDHALKATYKDTELSLQQLSATFRRGDLIEKLSKIPLSISRGALE